eukprot:1987107-Rhodomonas_salina.5
MMAASLPLLQAPQLRELCETVSIENRLILPSSLLNCQLLNSAAVALPVVLVLVALVQILASISPAALQ